jgi:SAM-dependent methyltransferase
MDYNKYALMWQAKKLSDTHYAHKYLEKPAITQILGEVKGLCILDLGCGSGEDVELFKKDNEVIGLDNSEELLNLARFNSPEVEFWNVNLNTQDIPQTKKFDLIYSSLTFHYIKDWDKLLSQLYKILKPNGRVVFSTHHPIKWGSKTAKTKAYNSFEMGYKKIKDSNEFEIYGDYLNTYPITEMLFQQLEITHYNRPISSMVQSFINSGFIISTMLEPKPTIESKSVVPDFYEVHNKIPLFIVWELTKTSKKTIK